MVLSARRNFAELTTLVKEIRRVLPRTTVFDCAITTSLSTQMSWSAPSIHQVVLEQRIRQWSTTEQPRDGFWHWVE